MSFFFTLRSALRISGTCCALHHKPHLFDQAAANEIMQGVIYHAVPHLIAAARLYDFVPDLFKEQKPERAKLSREEIIKRMESFPERAPKIIEATKRARDSE